MTKYIGWRYGNIRRFKLYIIVCFVVLQNTLFMAIFFSLLPPTQEFTESALFSHICRYWDKKCFISGYEILSHSPIMSDFCISISYLCPISSVLVLLLLWFSFSFLCPSFQFQLLLWNSSFVCYILVFVTLDFFLWSIFSKSTKQINIFFHMDFRKVEWEFTFLFTNFGICTAHSVFGSVFFAAMYLSVDPAY